jgi:hypothetical protein
MNSFLDSNTVLYAYMAIMPVKAGSLTAYWQNIPVFQRR